MGKTISRLEIRKRVLARRLLEVMDRRVIDTVEHVLGDARSFTLSPAQRRALDAQLEAYLKGEATTWTWDEVKAHALKKRRA